MHPDLLIHLSRFCLDFSRPDGTVLHYPIAIGAPDTPTPQGLFTICNKKLLPEPSVFGHRWMGLSLPGYGIHGTNHPDSIGHAVSLGCIRMKNADIEALFPLVRLGMTVRIDP